MNTKSLETMRKALRDELENIYRADPDSEQFKRVVKNYDALLTSIVNHFGGEDKTPASEDPDLYEVFHNCYKSDNGFRPRHELTIAEMKSWLDSRREAA